MVFTALIANKKGICPICDKEGLIIALFGLIPGRRVTICSNEKYRHIKANGVEFICRAPKEEVELNLN